MLNSVFYAFFVMFIGYYTSPNFITVLSGAASLFLFSLMILVSLTVSFITFSFLLLYFDPILTFSFSVDVFEFCRVVFSAQMNTEY